MPDIPTGAITSWRLKPLTKKPAKPRIRAWTPKTRTGCLTCKQRRVKCDETKPQCLRCVKGNFRCDGYADPKAWLFEPDSDNAETYIGNSSSSSSSDSSLSPPTHELTAVPSLWTDAVDTSAQRALQYFGERAQPELATFTYAAASFWNDIIPRVYTANGTIRHAVIAVASLHEMTRSRVMDPAASATNTLYLKHYSQAIQDLTRHETPPAKEIVLMSCLIFLTCANLLDSAPGVLIHLQSGLKLLREWRESASRETTSPADSASDILLNYLEPIFARLEAQSSLIPTPSREVKFYPYDLNWKAPALPDSFNNFNTARNCMHDIIQYCWFQGKRVAGPILPSNPVHRAFLYQLTQWDTIFTTSFPRHNTPSWPLYRTATGLRIHVQALSLAFRNEAFQDPLWMDTQHEVVKRLVDQIEDIILAGLPDPTKTQYGFDDIWARDFCLQPPMLLLGLHCHNPAMRRRIVHLKRLHHCWYSDDEPYDGCGSARLIELVMDTEERGLPSPPPPSSSESPHNSSSTPAPQEPPTFIPASQRIRPVAVVLDIPGKLALSYQSYVRGGSNTDTDTDTDQTQAQKYWREVPWPAWAPPPIPRVQLYPFAEMVVHGNFQGMIRPPRNHCLCKSLGGPHQKMWRAPT